MLIFITFYLFTVQDKIGSWFSNPGAGTAESGGMGGGGGVGKYMKGGMGGGGDGVGKYMQSMNPEDSATVDNSTSGVGKKRKVASASNGFKDFAGW